MDDIHLENCPLCGGKADMVEFRLGPGQYDATIVCSCCGLWLEWSQPFVEVFHPNGNKTYVPTGLTPEQAWNRRVKEGK